MTSFGAQIQVGENERAEFKPAFDEEVKNIWMSKAAYKKIVHFVECVGKWEEKFV